jgi:hypothetical protein
MAECMANLRLVVTTGPELGVEWGGGVGRLAILRSVDGRVQLKTGSDSISCGSRAQWALTARMQSTRLPDFFEYGRVTGYSEITIQ